MDERKNRSVSPGLLIAGGLAIVLFAAGGVLVYRFFGEAGTNVAAAVTSVVLSALLVILYYRQANLQSEQITIMEKQRTLSQQEKRPYVQVEGHRAGSGPGDYSVEPLEVLLSNIGPSPATNIQLELITGFRKNISLESGRTSISLRKANLESDWRRDWGTYLEGNTRNQKFTAEPLMVGWFDKDTNESRRIGLGLADEHLSKHSANDAIRLKAAILYDGLAGEQFREPLFDYIIPIEMYAGIRSALERGQRYQSAQTEYPIPEEVPTATLLGISETDD